MPETLLPFVSLIIPCRNEEAFIEKCLNSLLGQTYSKNRMEILIVDGMSQDQTRKAIGPYIKEHPFIKILDNPKFIIPVAMNIGIRHAKGSIIMKMDAHTIYPKPYVAACVNALTELKADNVGGTLITLPSKNTIQAKSIAFALSHPFGVGSSPFRRQAQNSEPREADTVAFGCFRKNVFDRVGLYNEHLVRSSDMELNLRIKRSGGKIFLLPKVTAFYHPSATLWKFLTHNIEDGIWAIYPTKFTGTGLALRHYIPLGFVGGLIIIFLLGFVDVRFFYGGLLVLLFYFYAAFTASIGVAMREKNARYLAVLTAAFAIRHLAYGAGSLAGLAYLVMPRP